MNNLLQEFKRRKVIRVTAFYAVFAWAVIQVADVVLPTFNAPQSLNQAIILTLLLGLPLVAILSWVFDFSHEGIEKTRPLQEGESIVLRKRDYLLGSLLLILVSAFTAQQLIGFVRLDTGVSVDFDDKSIAVLPFLNLSPDAENDWFAAGVHEEILNQLFKVNDLRVTSRTSVLKYKQSNLSAREIARELGVNTIMEGSVRFAGNQVRITTQLINAKDDVNLWADTYQREIDDIFIIQSDVALQVANALQATLSPIELSLIERPSTSSTEAYTLFLQYRYQQQQEGAVYTSSETGWVEMGIQRMERAITLDPGYAEGNAELGFLKYYKGFNGTGEFREPLLDEAVHYSKLALEMDSTITRAYTTLSLVALARGDLTTWEDYAQQSLKYADNDGRATLNVAQALDNQGRHEEAAYWMDIAISKNPSVPEYRRRAAMIALNLGNFESALTVAEQYLALGGSEFEYRNIRIAALYLLGRAEEAMVDFEQVMANKSSDLFPMVLHAGSVLDFLRCKEGQYDDVMAEIDRLGPRPIVRNSRVSSCALGMNDLDVVFDLIRTAIRMRVPLSNFANSPMVEQAKKDPRWAELDSYLQ